jgi:hypothetical protein
MWWKILFCAAIVGCAPETAPASAPTRTSRASVLLKNQELVNETAGRLNRAQIQRFVKAHEKEVRACYEGEVRADPTFQGGIDLSWEILPDGSVSAAMLSRSTLDNSGVEDCVLRQVRAWRFPPSDSQTSVPSFPLRFPL